MSYWVYLEEKDKDDERRVVQVERHQEGGTYASGGTKKASLNITYNYAKVYFPLGFSLRRGLDGQRAKDVISLLEELVEELGTDRNEDYWEATPGNAGYALNILLGWAKQHPEAIFSVS